MPATPARIQVLQPLIDRSSGSTYVEIGVSRGHTFREIQAPTKIAIDPTFRFRVPLRARLQRLMGARRGELFFEMPSDVFFDRHADRLFADRGLDVAFVDGLHEWRQALRDVENALQYLSDDGWIVIHDCNPATEAAAAPSLDAAQATPGFDGTWNGDVYKAIVHLRMTRPDLDVYVLDDDHGLGIVRRRGSDAPAPDLTVESVDDLGYTELERRRSELLGLRPMTDCP